MRFPQRFECSTMPSFNGRPMRIQDAGRVRVPRARGSKRRRVSEATSLDSAQLEVRLLIQLVNTGVPLNTHFRPC